ISRNTCRIVRRGCNESRVLRPCLQWSNPPRPRPTSSLPSSRTRCPHALRLRRLPLPTPSLWLQLYSNQPSERRRGPAADRNWHLYQATLKSVFYGGTTLLLYR
ncbi:unnamed protein product, partial [Musa hybrid cultivar]